MSVRRTNNPENRAGRENRLSSLAYEEVRRKETILGGAINFLQASVNSKSPPAYAMDSAMHERLRAEDQDQIVRIPSQNEPTTVATDTALREQAQASGPVMDLNNPPNNMRTSRSELIQNSREEIVTDKQRVDEARARADQIYREIENGTKNN